MVNQSNHSHEVLAIFAAENLGLSTKLEEMLNEHYIHQTERRGCGYTQATRVLAEYVNAPRAEDDFADLKLFADYPAQSLRNIVNYAKANHLDINGWRNLDQQQAVQQYIQNPPAASENYASMLHLEVQRQQTLRALKHKATLEESRYIIEIIEDIILAKDAQQEGLSTLTTLQEKPKVGSCPMAEKFFLEIAHRRLLRQGKINIFVDDSGQPLMLEKLNMGDNHSCISLVPLMMNGVRLPEGCLFSVSYDDEKLQKTPNKKLAGHVIPAAQCDGFWFMRLTTLAVSPQNRARAFTTHFEQQKQNGLFSPDTTQLSQLLTVALEQI
jgi:hypothetical protein